MNNIGTLYKYEIKKILQKKSVLLSMLAGIGVVVLLIFTYVSSDGHIDYINKQRKVLDGISGQKLDEEFFKNYSNEVNSELEENSEKYEKIIAYDKGSAYLAASDAIYKKNLFDYFYDVIRDRNGVVDLTASEFKDKMRENIINDGTDFGASSEELNIWLEEYDSIEQPITYAYVLGYYNIMNVLFVIGWALFIVIAISMSGVFADEKVNRTDSIILSTRKGRMTLCIAKILSGVTVALAETVLILGSCSLTILCIYGFEGYDGMIQNLIPSSAWNITIGKMMGIYVILAVATSTLYALSNMLLSHLTKSSVVTMAIHTAILFLGLFNVPASFGIIAKLWRVEPTLALHWGTFLNTYRYGSLNNVEFSFILYGAIILLFTVWLVQSYRKSQVESR